MGLRIAGVEKASTRTCTTVPNTSTETPVVLSLLNFSGDKTCLHMPATTPVNTPRTSAADAIALGNQQNTALYLLKNFLFPDTLQHVSKGRGHFTTVFAPSGPYTPRGDLIVSINKKWFRGKRWDSPITTHTIYDNDFQAQVDYWRQGIIVLKAAYQDAVDQGIEDIALIFLGENCIKRRNGEIGLFETITQGTRSVDIPHLQLVYLVPDHLQPFEWNRDDMRHETTFYRRIKSRFLKEIRTHFNKSIFDVTSIEPGYYFHIPSQDSEVVARVMAQHHRSFSLAFEKVTLPELVRLRSELKQEMEQNQQAQIMRDHFERYNQEINSGVQDPVIEPKQSRAITYQDVYQKMNFIPMGYRLFFQLTSTGIDVIISPEFSRAGVMELIKVFLDRKQSNPAIIPVEVEQQFYAHVANYLKAGTT